MEFAPTSDRLKEVVEELYKSIRKLESDPAFLDMIDLDDLCYRIVADRAALDEVCDGIVYCAAIHGTPALQRLSHDELVELVTSGELPDDPRVMHFIVCSDIRNQLLEKLQPIDRSESWAFFTPQRRLLTILGIPFTIFAGLCHFCEPVEAFVLLWTTTLYLHTKLRTTATSR